MKRIVKTFRKSDRGNRAYAVIALCVTTAIVLPAQTFTTLHSFNGTDGLGPAAALVQATDGDRYGTTAGGGSNGNYGTFFKISPSGNLTTLYNFCAQSGCTDGYGPGELVQATNGDFYGTTSAGGANGNYGTFFKISPSGNLTTLYNFCAQSGCTDGYLPFGKLVQTTDGDFYGTTSSGGANGRHFGGTVFKITPNGMLTTLYSFCAQSGCPDGFHPPVGLIQATNGDFYGTTGYGGANTTPDNPDGGGTVFKITPNGALTTLYSFCAQSGCRDGQSPHAGLVQATDGDLYGTTLFGGDADGRGTVFKITPSGAFTALYRFCSKKNCADGAGPEAGLVQAANGDLYGTTSYFGANGENQEGTIFKISPRGTLTTLYGFCSQIGCTDGQSPDAALVQDTDGTFYGTAVLGGAHNDGTVFSLSVGLGPFVETQPTSGKVGSVVKILGTNLTGTISVSFNGAAAVFEVVSSSEITATVPADATSGKLKVVTPQRTLSSNVPFRVQP